MNWVSVLAGLLVVLTVINFAHNVYLQSELEKKKAKIQASYGTINWYQREVRRLEKSTPEDSELLQWYSDGLLSNSDKAFSVTFMTMTGGVDLRTAIRVVKGAS